jgi:hypothetical protein
MNSAIETQHSFPYLINHLNKQFCQECRPDPAAFRITVEQIMRKLAGGITMEEILADHPHLTREDILAAHEFAADFLADEEVAFI